MEPTPVKTMLFNPYNGLPRHPSDIASDPQGTLMVDPDEPLRPSVARPDKDAQIADLKLQLDASGIEDMRNEIVFLIAQGKIKDTEIASFKAALRALEEMLDWETLDPALMSELIYRTLNPVAEQAVQK
jgi:hypothetical protein